MDLVGSFRVVEHEEHVQAKTDDTRDETDDPGQRHVPGKANVLPDLVPVVVIRMVPIVPVPKHHQTHQQTEH